MFMLATVSVASMYMAPRSLLDAFRLTPLSMMEPGDRSKPATAWPTEPSTAMRI